MLHSLLPVERIEKKDEQENIVQDEDNNDSNASDQWDQIALSRRKNDAQVNVVNILLHLFVFCPLKLICMDFIFNRN